MKRLNKSLAALTVFAALAFCGSLFAADQGGQAKDSPAGQNTTAPSADSSNPRFGHDRGYYDDRGYSFCRQHGPCCGGYYYHRDYYDDDYGYHHRRGHHGRWRH